MLDSEKTALFQRFKEKDIDKLQEMSIIFKAHGNYEKAEVVDLLIDINSRDVPGLKSLHKALMRSGALTEAEYVRFLLENKLSINKTKQQKKRARGRGRKDADKKEKAPSPLGLSQEAYEAMAERIKLNAQRHRDRVKDGWDE